MLSSISKFFALNKNEKQLKAIRPIVEKINALGPEISKLSDDELKNQTIKLRKLYQDGIKLPELLPEAFATVREAADRALGERPYDVQIMGGIVLSYGKIAEMKTGEGKTLTAVLALYLHSLTGKGAHLVTVNDYLASRDAQWMGKVFGMLDVTVGCIVSNMSDEDRKNAYRCDVTYGTNNEFAFDYLRDNMKFSLDDYVQQGHNYCIVDEVDSILIDEARTPLLISGPSEESNQLYHISNKVIPMLQKNIHFTADEKAHSAMLTDEGVLKVQEALKIDNLYKMEHTPLLHHLNQSLRAHHLFHKDVNYVVRDGRIIIVDEFTGRLKEGSRWSDGLHGAIEAKEGVPIKVDQQTLASITFQNYFRMYDSLAGMTGTAETEAEEFEKIYNLEVVSVPTNLKMIRNDQPDVIYKTKDAKYRAVVKLIEDLHKKGQPVLVGTISIENSEQIAKILEKKKIPHEVLNAKNHAREAQIIVNAGQKGSVTIATNMAGRGTDIKLSPETKAVGGLFILGTERHESRRIDNQLRGRSGRQGDPGASKFFLSLEDDLMRIFGSDRIKSFMNTLGMEEDEPIEHKIISNNIAKAQKKVESHNFEIRKHLLEYDNVMHDQRKIIYAIRRDILADNGNMELITDMLEDSIEQIVDSLRPQKKVPIDMWPWDELSKSFQALINSKYEISIKECESDYSGDISNYLLEIAKKLLKEKFASYDPEQVRLALREILLSIFDQHWKEHLRAMDHVKEGVGLRAYAQKNPLNEYKSEAYNLFEQMRIAIKKSVVQNVFSVHFYTEEEIEQLKKRQQAQLEAQLAAHKKAQENAQRKDNNGQIKRGENKIGRNDPCPCGSGKKFKQCHGA